MKDRRTDTHERQTAEIDHIFRRAPFRACASRPRPLSIDFMPILLDARRIWLRLAVRDTKRVLERRRQRQRPLGEIGGGSGCRFEKLEERAIHRCGAYERPNWFRLTL